MPSFGPRATQRLLLFVLFGLANTLNAQQINLSLHSTAVPDSFMVRATATSGVFTAIPNAVFTVRWELEAGGAIDDTDVRPACGGYSLSNSVGVVDVLDHRYFSLVLIGERALGMECAITPQGRDIGGFRIRELSGCRNVELVQNGYTLMNNVGYYFSIGGLDVTGMITSPPIAGGVCGPCVPPVIGSATATVPVDCNGSTALQMTASGSAYDVSWYDVHGAPFGWMPSLVLPDNPAHVPDGPYLVVVSNLCGTDSLEVPVVADPVYCIPLAGMTATLQQQNTTTSFLMAAAGSCIGYNVIAPDGTEYATQFPSGYVTIPVSEGVGTYLAIAFNACGADTVPFVLTAIPTCDLPLITEATASLPPCNPGPLTLSATASIVGSPVYEWSDPLGIVVANTLNATLPMAIAGDYTLSVTTECGTTNLLVPVALDTAGLGACVPPVINSLTACAVEVLQLTAEVEAADPCLTYEWVGYNVVQSGAASTSAPGGEGVYLLRVTNACGWDVMSTSGSQELQNVQLCDGLSAPVPLDSLATGQEPGGAWQLVDGTPHSGIYDPAMDTTSAFIYYLDGYCPVLILTVTEMIPFDTGTEASVTICSTDAPVDLFTILGGTPETGGWWFQDMMAPWGGIYDPQIDVPGRYTYTHYQPDCLDTTTVIVTEVEYLQWYADTDGDGFGDPDALVESCDAPAGYVADATDNCPATHGLIGAPCDDGNPSTSGDVLNDDCICAGQIHAGIGERNDEQGRLWPNPNRTGSFNLYVPDARGPVQLLLSDATGRVVMNSTFNASSAPLAVQLPEAIATGTYWVRVITASGSATHGLVLQR